MGCYALMPLVLASVYPFGWRSLILIAVFFVCGVATGSGLAPPHLAGYRD